MSYFDKPAHVQMLENRLRFDRTPSRVTTARQTRSPSRASATGNAAAFSIASCRSASASMRAGWMLRPPRMITSFLRPVTRR